MSFRIDNGGASVTFLARRQGELLLSAGHYALRVAEDRLSDISEATNRINRLQMRGSFHLDFAEGRVVHRNTHWIGQRKATQREWEELLDATILAMFTWYPVFARILQGDDVVAEVIHERVQALAADAP